MCNTSCFIHFKVLDDHDSTNFRLLSVFMIMDGVCCELWDRVVVSQSICFNGMFLIGKHELEQGKAVKLQ
jgi:hypothetical protein